MTPGRELDALVAEKVMGYKRLEPTLDWPERWLCDDRKLGGIPAYSTDIAAAWEVVEKLSAKHPYITIIRVGTAPTEWVIAEGPGDSDPDLARAPTVPYAICLAALKSVASK